MPKPKPNLVDAKAIEDITGVNPGTLNVWISRRLVSGTTAGAQQGRRRMFDTETVIFIAVLAELIRLGYEAPYASQAAAEARRFGFDRKTAKMIIAAPVLAPGSLTKKPDIYSCDGSDGVDVFLSSFDKPSPTWGSRPKAYVVVEVWRIAEDVKKFIAAMSAEKR